MIILSFSFVGYSRCRHHLCCQIGMYLLVIKKYMCTECPQKFFLRDTTQEKGFIHPHFPFSQGTDDSFMSRRTSGSYQCNTDGHFLSTFSAHHGKLFEQPCKRAFRQGTACSAPFTFLKGLQSFFLKNLFCLIGKKNRIPMGAVLSYAVFFSIVPLESPPLRRSGAFLS